MARDNKAVLLGVCSAKLILYAEQRTQDRYKYMAPPLRKGSMMDSKYHHCTFSCSCFPAKTPPLSRQDATLSESTYALRPKENSNNKKIHKKNVWWKEENKENVPPQDDEKEDLERHVKKEA